MKQIILTLLIFTSLIVNAQTLTFKGEVINDCQFTMIIEEYNENNEIVLCDTIPYYNGIFGKENGFKITNLKANSLYKIVFTNNDYFKYVIINTYGLITDNKLIATVDLTLPNVYVFIKDNIIFYVNI